MPNSPKLYLNEHLSPRLAAQLRQHGFDVVSTQEVGLLAEADAEQLIFAVTHQRAVVTINTKDFALLHQEYLAQAREHWGLVFSTQQPIGVLFQRLLRLLHSSSAEELRNQIRWLNEFK